MKEQLKVIQNENLVKIEKNIPMPRTAGNRKYPWAIMEVGDSFFIPGKTADWFSPQADGATKRTGFKFSCRTMDGGVRVWRIK